MGIIVRWLVGVDSFIKNSINAIICWGIAFLMILSIWSGRSYSDTKKEKSVFYCIAIGLFIAFNVAVYFIYGG